MIVGHDKTYKNKLKILYFVIKLLKQNDKYKYKVWGRGVG